MKGDVIYVNHEKLLRALLLLQAAKIPTCIIGGVGTGKTQAVKKFHSIVHEQIPECKLRMLLLSVMENTDMAGFPSIDDGKLKFNMLDTLPFDCDDPDIIFADEMDRGDSSVLNTFTQVLVGRQINGHYLSPNCHVIMAMNGTSDIYTTPLPEAIRNRVCTLFLSSDPSKSMETWDEWAAEEGIHHSIRGFAHFEVNAFNRKKDFEELALPTPRTRDMLSDVMHVMDKVSFRTDDLILPIAAGLIGRAAAVQFKAYMDFFNQLPPLKEILDDPDCLNGMDVYDNHGHSYAVGAYICNRVTEREQAVQAVEICKRVGDEAGFFLARALQQKIPDVASDPGFLKYSSDMRGLLVGN